MYSPFQLFFKYLSHYLTASSGQGHGMHSPFVFEFVTKVLNDKTRYDDYQKAEQIRSRCRGDNTVLYVEDYGAGSQYSTASHRSVSSIVKHAVKSKKYARLLYRMVRYYRPGTTIELGSSLGITTSYVAMANPKGNVLTFEGSRQVAKIALQNFKQLNLENIRLIEGNFDYTLPASLYYLSTVDLAFIDGNHRRDPTLQYFQCLLAKRNNDSIFIFDDIHWSREMEQAWQQISEHPAARCTIDLFFIGIVFFRQEFREKQHFNIRF